MSRRIGVILSYILMIFEVLSTLLLTPFIIRTLGQAEYGVYKLVAAVNAYLLLLDLGVGNAVTRYIAKYRISGDREKERQFLGVATVFYGVVAIIAVVVGSGLVAIFPTAFARGLSASEIRLGQTLLGITMLNSAISLGTAAHNNILIAYERFAISRGMSIIQILVRMGLTCLTLSLGYGSVGIVLINLLTTVCCRGFFVGYVLRQLKLRPLFRGIEFSFVKEIVAYSSLILVQMIATQLNATVDQILIGSLVNASAVILAVYGVGTQIVQYYQSIGSAFGGVLMPGVVRLVEGGASAKELTNEMIRVGRITFIMLVMIWCGFAVFGKEFICLWAGNENREAYGVALILMSVYTFILSEAIGTQILWAKNLHKEQAILKIVIVLINVLLTIVLIKWNPLIGATIGTFCSLMLGDVGVMNWIFRKQLKIDLVYYYHELLRGIVPCAFITVIAGIIIRRLLPSGWIWLCVKLLCIVVIYGIVMLKFGMSSYERKLVLSIVNRAKVRRNN